MLRKLFIFVLAMAAFVPLGAQNLQLHYDFRNSLHGNDIAARNYLTATFEMFKPDAWGSTFMFVDFDFNLEKGNIGLTYAEIARAVKLGNLPVMAHFEFNGGLGNGFSIDNAYLVGAQYPFKAGHFFMSTYVAYKLNAFKKASHDVQWTVTWTGNFAGNKLTLGGFADLWTENKNPVSGEGGKRVVFLSEPQIWYNLTLNFSLGSEFELSYNFVNKFNESKFYVLPTLAAKWNF